MSSKISELTALGETPADDDIFPIVDTSASQTKSVTYANLRGPTSAGTKVLLEEITLSTAGEFDFDNIPQDYDRLILQGEARGDSASVLDNVYILFNADTTVTNYHRQNNVAANGAADNAEDATPKVAILPAASAPSGAYGQLSATIENYSGTNKKTVLSQFTGEDAVGQVRVGQRGVAWDSTAAITRIRIRTDNHPTDQLTGTLRLYGEKSLTLEDSETIIVKKKVATITDPAAGEFDFDFTNFQDGDRIVIEGTLDSTASADQDLAYLFLNADTTAANYHRQFSGGFDAAAYLGEGATPNIGVVTGSTALANDRAKVRFVIEDYTGADAKIAEGTSLWRATTGQVGVVDAAVASAITDPVTRIRIRTDNHSTDTLTGTLTAYIEKEGVLPVSQGPHVIETITLSTAGEFDFDNIPQGYRRLVIRGQVLSSAAAVIDSSYIHINGDTTAANYHHQNILANNTVVNSTETAEPVVGVVAGSTGSQAFSPLKIEIEGYAQTFRKSIVSETNVEEAAATLRQYRHMVIHDTDDTAITRIQIRTNNHPTDGLTGTLTLYGEY